MRGCNTGWDGERGDIGNPNELNLYCIQVLGFLPTFTILHVRWTRKLTLRRTFPSVVFFMPTALARPVHPCNYCRGVHEATAPPLHDRPALRSIMGAPHSDGKRMTDGEGKPKFSPVGIVLLVGLLLLIVVGVGVWWLWPRELSIGGENTIEGMVAQIRSWGPWAALGSIALMVVHSFLPLPAEIITLANGMVFGPFWGTVITWVGAMLGAISTFGLARMLGRPFVYRMLSESQLHRLSEWSSARGDMALLIGRLIPLIAFNLLNYSAALTDISWWTFIWATGLGILPLTILLNVFGARVLTMTAWNWVWLLLGALAILGGLLARRRSRARRGE